jgi:uncharacterized protein YbjT (DUF2867 family)
MKIAILGATGLTGGLVVKRALEQGHEVIALVRDPKRLAIQHPHLTVVAGSPLSKADLEKYLEGVGAVVHCLGVGGKGDGKHTTLISDSVKAVIAVMQRQGIRRLVCMSNVGAGGSGTWFANRIFIPIFLKWLVPIIEDKDRMEKALDESALDWVSVRLPNIIDGLEKSVRVSQDGRGIGLSITAASAAAFLLGQVTSPEFIRKTPSISN